MNTAESAIDIHDLYRQYGDFTAVNGISLGVARGETFGLLGTNGAGKTSTLEVMEGLAAPSAGTVRVLGHNPVTERATVRPHTGIMLQSGGLPQALTVQETLTMWAGTCSAPAPSNAVLGDVHLDHRRDVTVGALSGGEKRRLDLACALVGNPQILFLDEPTTGLDPESRRHVWDLLRRLKAAGVTIVLTTHYLEEAEELCDRIAIMHQGRINVEGTMSELASIAASEITFSPSPPSAPLPQLSGTTIHRADDTVTITTSNLQKDTQEVLTWANDHGVTLNGFTARPARLEQVFHSIANS
ncbi:ABC transporter ATP-binding protein [Corynebacterium sp. BF-R-2]|uniref:ABC transporter ATP-binding protein n=1 Tax=Corynebacterium sp. BF-R-2 TaxID=2943494 RepID=UPI00211DF746|nr:ABC transporter ATP-binding protein [Corynebacterium sp. BF-R-2]MCQ9677544.1 ABC transporter ATP-binding protein [Corynebacterium sp. BF-R-2]